MLSGNTKNMDLQNITIEALQWPALAEKKVTADVLRLDKIDPVISGNKWFKLKYYLEKATREKRSTLLTFGGAYSNHILAVARAAQRAGIASVGMIRGERSHRLSPTLEMAMQYGMKLEFMSRASYRQKESGEQQALLTLLFPEALIIPEGGCGPEGLQGCCEILSLARQSLYSHIICATGTGTMFCGLARSSSPGQKITGISVLKGIREWPHQYLEWIDGEKLKDCNLIGDYHFGGYAKKTPALIGFMNLLYDQAGIPTDFVYTGKLFYGVMDRLKKNDYDPGSRLLIVHSGGLQGNASLPAESLLF